MDVPPTVVSDASPLGEDYLAAMTLAGRYAYAGREAVARHVVRGILRANASKRCTTITTSPGAKSTTGSNIGLSEKERRRHFRGRKVSSAGAWEMTR